MWRAMRFVPLALLGWGCGDKAAEDDDDTWSRDSAEADADADADADTDTDADADADADTGVGPPDDLDREVCEGVEGFEGVPGATVYFWGRFTEQGTATWIGEERMLLYANDAWEAAGGADCEVVWNATAATEGGGGACTGCAWTLAVSASVDASRSTCPPDLYAGAENYAADYGIAELEGGSIDLHFTGSGNRFAGGTIEGAVLEYLSDATCNWY